MKIYRFVPDIGRYAHPWRSGSRWWPETIHMGSWMETTHNMSKFGFAEPRDGHYRAPPDMPLSDFPWLSLQLPIMSERAAECLGTELAGRLRPIEINGARFFAVQPLMTTRGDPEPFVAAASRGIQMPRGEIVHYHTLAFDSAQIRGELFTLGAHEPYSETYVTEAFIERVRAAGLIGLDPELVYDDGPVAPSYPPPTQARLADPSWYAKEMWELFNERGSMLSYMGDELREAFARAQLAGLLPG